MRRFSFLLLIIISVFQHACSTRKMAQSALKSIEPKDDFSMNSDEIIDYSDQNNWFIFQNNTDEDVDVFFVHPTTFMSDDHWNQPMKDSVNIAKTIRKIIQPQVMLFDTVGRLFVPKYRQATFYSFFDTDSNGVQALDLAYLDVKNAFIHYMNSQNNGQELILAGHSQGSFHLIRLLKDKEVQEMIGDQMIAAYLIGWPVIESDLANMPYEFCEDSLELNCICSWNAQRENTKFSIQEFAKGEQMFSTNPLSWTIDEKHYDKSWNKGAYFFKKDTMLYRPNYIGARNENGLLIVDKPKEKGKLGIRKGTKNYHIYDIYFFYNNLQSNALQRKNKMLKSSLDH